MRDSTRAATCALAWALAGVKDHKGNTSLTKLDLRRNKVGDAGATALAEAVKATVLKCVQQLFTACAGCCNGCRFARWSKQLASPSCCAVCFAPSVCYCFLEENFACCGVLFASCSQVDVARFQNRIGLSESLASGTCLIAERHHITSSGLMAAPCEQRP